ncbi:hypothetical protein AES38_01785 [Clavibacter capsici]|nr:hypothetical protein AES38_01785 [Clavibacter capsici]
MSVADRADLPLFHAPDGTAHVDRRGLSADTPRSWRRAHDPRSSGAGPGSARRRSEAARSSCRSWAEPPASR